MWTKKVQAQQHRELSLSPKPSDDLPETAEAFMDGVLELHNSLRARHGVPSLSWSAECEAHAQLQADMCYRANRISNGNCKEHSEGQNVYMKSPAAPGTAAVQAWYDEMRFGGYDFHTHSGASAQNFAQIVWEGTTHVGAARSIDGRYIVANYQPPSNSDGHPFNVFPQTSRPPASPPSPKSQVPKAGAELDLGVAPHSSLSPHKNLERRVAAAREQIERTASQLSESQCMFEQLSSSISEHALFEASELAQRDRQLALLEARLQQLMSTN